MRRLAAERVAVDGKLAPEAFIFTHARGKAISDMTMLKVLRDMKLVGITVHGFRSTFTDWAAEQTEFPKEVVDKALAHTAPNAVEGAYRRTDFFDKRRTLMDQWAAFVMVAIPEPAH